MLTRSVSIIAIALLLVLTFTSCEKHRSAINKGKKQFEAGQYDAAAVSFEAALQMKPESPEAQTWLKKAKEKACEIHYGKALQTEQNQEWTRAASEYKRVLELIPDYQDASERLGTVQSAAALSYYQKAVGYQKTGKWDNALRDFEKALRCVGDFQDTQNKIQETKQAAAEEYYQQAIRLMEQGNQEQMLASLRRCWQYVPDYKDSRQQEKKAKRALAMIRYQQGVLVSSPSVESVRELLKHKYDGIAEIRRLTKVDGQEGQVFGVPVYSLTYEGEVQFTDDCREDRFGNFSYISGRPILGIHVAEHRKGGRKNIKGRVIFEKSERGWKGREQ